MIASFRWRIAPAVSPSFSACYACSKKEAALVAMLLTSFFSSVRDFVRSLIGAERAVGTNRGLGGSTFAGADAPVTEIAELCFGVGSLSLIHI